MSEKTEEIAKRTQSDDGRKGHKKLLIKCGPTMYSITNRSLAHRTPIVNLLFRPNRNPVGRRLRNGGMNSAHNMRHTHYNETRMCEVFVKKE